MARDDGNNRDGGIGASLPKSFRVSVEPVNNAPFFAPPVALEVLEDSEHRVFRSHVKAISAGPGGEATQQRLSFTARAEPAALFVEGPTVDPITGDVSFKAAPNMFGTAAVTLTLLDDGGVANGGKNSWTDTLTVRILPVNDAPSFVGGAAIGGVLEDSLPAVVPGWATTMLPGPSNELGQELFFEASVDRPELFEVAPAVAYPSGDLRFTPYPDASGEARVTLRLRDGGGVAHGGVDSSPPLTLRINIEEVNDPPTFVAGAPVVVVLKDSGRYRAEAPWATAVSAGPFDERRTQHVNFTVRPLLPSLFAEQPRLTSGGFLEFSTAPGAEGNTTAVVLATDSAGMAGVPTQIRFVIAPHAPEVLRAVVGDAFAFFSSTRFATTVAAALEVPSSRIMIVGIQPAGDAASVVDFYFSERAPGDTAAKSSKQLADAFLLKMRDAATDAARLRETLRIMEAYPVGGDGSPRPPGIANLGDGGSDGLQGGYVAAIVILAVLAAAALAFLAFWLLRRRSRRRAALEKQADDAVAVATASGASVMVLPAHHKLAHAAAGASSSSAASQGRLYDVVSSSGGSGGGGGGAAAASAASSGSFAPPAHEREDNPLRELFQGTAKPPPLHPIGVSRSPLRSAASFGDAGGADSRASRGGVARSRASRWDSGGGGGGGDTEVGWGWGGAAVRADAVGVAEGGGGGEGVWGDGAESVVVEESAQGGDVAVPVDSDIVVMQAYSPRLRMGMLG